jgi:hypothetical protein
MEPSESKQSELALTFAKSLVAGDYESANKMLSASLREELSLTKLKQTYEEMVNYFETPPNPEYTELIDGVWRDEDSDIGWAYISICCDGELEAVSVTMTQESEDIVILKIDWGRP